MRGTVLFICLAAILLGGCGRRGDIVPPDGGKPDPRLEKIEKEEIGHGQKKDRRKIPQESG
ncbi:MAG: hypothetical protein ACE5ED_03780 [Rhodothalassiaceae bacterium]